MRLSVIIPNYNYGDYVGAAIESALALDWPDVEVIVVDDGSTDHSREVISKFGDRITAIYQVNATQRVACKVGYARSTGEAILFLDSDDLVHPDLAKEVAGVWRLGLSKVQVQMMRIDAEGRPLNSAFPAYRPMPTPAKIRDWAARTTAYPTPPGSGNVYSKTFLDMLFPLDNFCGDFSDSVCLAAAPFLGEVETVAKPLIYYRVHDTNDSKLTIDDSRFSREIRRASNRAVFANKIRPEELKSLSSNIFGSLEILRLRTASIKMRPDSHPLPEDTLLRILLDCFTASLLAHSVDKIRRVAIFLWCTLTLISPRYLSKTLIQKQYYTKPIPFTII